MQVVRTLVAERLAAAAEEIFTVVERKMLHTSEMLPEQLRTVVQKRLSAVADEICRILEIMLGEYEAEDIEQQRQLLDITMTTETNVHTSVCNGEKVIRSSSANEG
ncbi:zinc finger protein 260-like isoform X1 [Lates japonicus]